MEPAVEPQPPQPRRGIRWLLGCCGAPPRAPRERASKRERKPKRERHHPHHHRRHRRGRHAVGADGSALSPLGKVNSRGELVHGSVLSGAGGAGRRRAAARARARAAAAAARRSDLVRPPTPRPPPPPRPLHTPPQPRPSPPMMTGTTRRTRSAWPTATVRGARGGRRGELAPGAAARASPGARAPTRTRAPTRAGHTGPGSPHGGAAAGGSSGSTSASGSACDSDEYEASSDGGAPGGIGARLVSCLAIMRHDVSLTGGEPAVASPKSAVPRGVRPPAGCTLQVLAAHAGGGVLARARVGGGVRAGVGSMLFGRQLTAAPAPAPRQRRLVTDDPAAARWCWDEVDAATYSVRSLDYMRTKVRGGGQRAEPRCGCGCGPGPVAVAMRLPLIGARGHGSAPAAARRPPQIKVASAKSIYRLVGVDLFRTDAKAFHAARLVTLPPAREPARVGDATLPPLLIFNVQLPSYAAGFFGPSDGAGQSIVYYFALPEDFDAARFENQAALGLLARFVSNGREADGAHTRERLKMISRVANADEWARDAPLSAGELKLLVNYNEKPVLTRPQASGGGGRLPRGRSRSVGAQRGRGHRLRTPPPPPPAPPRPSQHFFFVGPNYLEVDMDVHSYAYIARKALSSYHARLKHVVWENAFVLQARAKRALARGEAGGARQSRRREPPPRAGRPAAPPDPTHATRAAGQRARGAAGAGAGLRPHLPLRL